MCEGAPEFTGQPRGGGLGSGPALRGPLRSAFRGGELSSDSGPLCLAICCRERAAAAGGTLFLRKAQAFPSISSGKWV